MQAASLGLPRTKEDECNEEKIAAFEKAAASTKPGPILTVRFLIGPVKEVTEDAMRATRRKEVNRAGMLLDSVAKIDCAPGEFALLATLLTDNAKLVKCDTFASSKESHNRKFQLSFIGVLRAPPTLMHGPPSAETAKSKCNLCEKESAVVQRCSGCSGATYCDRKCQKKDWSAHKLVCSRDDLKKPETNEDPAPPSPPPSDAFIARGQYSGESVVIDLTSLSGFSTAISFKTGATTVKDQTKVGQNLSGSTKFLVKVQTPLMGDGPMMLYDEKRVIQTLCVSPLLSAAVVKFSKTTPKAYFWAVREGDKLRVFIDKAAQMPTW